MQEKKTATGRVLAEALLIPAIRIAREAAAENADDPKVAKIFSDRAEELEKKAQEAGASVPQK